MRPLKHETSWPSSALLATLSTPRAESSLKSTFKVHLSRSGSEVGSRKRAWAFTLETLKQNASGIPNKGTNATFLILDSDSSPRLQLINVGHCYGKVALYGAIAMMQLLRETSFSPGAPVDRIKIPM